MPGADVSRTALVWTADVRGVKEGLTTASNRSDESLDSHAPMLKLDVVIPTWNEEGWLPGLLNRLLQMKLVDEIVVADNASEDRTRQIALAGGARVVEGGRPAQGRNNGALVTASEFIVFADADVVFSGKVLDRVVTNFEGNDDVVAVHFPYRPINPTLLARFSYWAMNHYVSILHRIGLAQGIGTFIAVRRAAFDKAGGFDESLSVGEDADLIRRLNRLGTVRYDKTQEVGTSIRRFRNENPAIFMAKTVLWAILRLLGKRMSLVGYRWRRYPLYLSELDKVPFELYFRSLDKPKSALQDPSIGAYDEQ